MANSRGSAKAEYWQQMLSDHRQSGMTVKAFCAEKKISCPSFYQWKQRLQSKPVDPANNSIVPVKLIPMQSCTAASNRFVQILTPGGFSIRVDSSMRAEDLAELLRAIESSPRGDAC